jgi:hypothetical protein
MRRSLLHFLLLLGFGMLADTIFAQDSARGRVTQLSRLNVLAARYENTFRQNYQKALRLARRNQWVISESLPDGTYLSLQGVTETNQPIYYITDNNARAAATTRTNQLWTGGRLGLKLSGNTPALTDKMGVWDGGWVSTTHQELVGRVVQRDERIPNDPETSSGHATHVAGTLMATGVVPIAQGMAYGFTGLQSYNFSNDIAEMAAAAPHLLISNHSYGELVGWRLNSGRAGNVKWEWNGDSNVSSTEDYRFGFYDDKTRLWDDICFNAPYYLPVKSAGNNRDENGPPVGQPYYRRNRSGGFSYVSARPAGINSNNGYDNIPTYGIAKNVLTVGAVVALSDGSNQPLDVQMSSFSNWGPTDDGRIKPDLVANGVDVLSSTSSTNDAYTTLSGTSMSTPNVAGSLLLLQEYYFQRNQKFMRSATLKGLAIHTTDEAGDAPGPDYRFGWGLLNVEKAARVIGNSDGTHQILERSLRSKERYELTVTASGKGPLVITLAWTDPPAAARTASKENLNNRAPLLVNDLDLRINEGTREVFPWVLDPANPAKAAAQGDNNRDNVENIRIEYPVPGKTYTIRISHKGSLENRFQAYSLLISGAGGKAYCGSQVQTTADGRIESVVLGEIRSVSAACAAYTDFTSVRATVSSGQVMPLTITTGSCGNSISQLVKTYADWNNDGDFTDTGEWLSTSGVLSGRATYQTSLAIPAGLPIGAAIRLRVVCVATTNLAEVQPCGNFGKGETEDYLLAVVRPVSDIGIASVRLSETDLCTTARPTVVVTLVNGGTALQRNIPVRVEVTSGNATVALLAGTVTDSLAAFGEAQLSLSGDFETLPGQEYTFSASAVLPNDQDSTNNQLSIRHVALQSSPTVVNAVFCDDQIRLSAGNTTGTAYWYASPTATEWLAAGNSTSSNARTADSTYYVGINDFSGRLGPAGKQAFAGGSYAGNFGPEPLLTTFVPLTLEKARLYIGHSGKLTFTVYTYNGIPVTSVTLPVTATRNPNLATGGIEGQSIDDPADEGQVYDLNLAIPEPGRYKIGISYKDGASIFRSNQGVKSYPFALPHIMQLTGALFGSDTLTNAYYYLYDMQVRALGCPGPRVAVKAKASGGAPPSATIRSSGNICIGEKATLTLSLTGTPPWSLVYMHNDQPHRVSNITTSPYVINTDVAGSYRIVEVGDALHCPVPLSGSEATIAYYPPPDLSLEAAGSLLTAGEGTRYRWFLNDVAIDTATRRTLIARKIGRYRVEVTSSNGCKARSAALLVEEAVTDDVLTGGWVRISPNPTAERVTVYLGSVHQVARLQLLNSLGQVVEQLAVAAEDKSIDLSLRLQSSGVYTIVLQNSTHRQAYRIVKL